MSAVCPHSQLCSSLPSKAGAHLRLENNNQEILCCNGYRWEWSISLSVNSANVLKTIFNFFATCKSTLFYSKKKENVILSIFILFWGAHGIDFSNSRYWLKTSVLK